ncbi:MAG: hypothetical protein ABSD42_08920 [Candidatus Bathyarchaeia archaeon]|jgi:hypothetical protein
MPSEERKATEPIKIENKIEDDKIIENQNEVKSIENNKATIPEIIEANSIKPM